MITLGTILEGGVMGISMFVSWNTMGILMGGYMRIMATLA